MMGQVKTIEDIREYVADHNDYLAVLWSEMLFDMDNLGEEYEFDAFIEQADIAVRRGKVSLSELMSQDSMPGQGEVESV